MRAPFHSRETPATSKSSAPPMDATYWAAGDETEFALAKALCCKPPAQIRVVAKRAFRRAPVAPSLPSPPLRRWRLTINRHVLAAVPGERQRARQAQQS